MWGIFISWTNEIQCATSSEMMNPLPKDGHYNDVAPNTLDWHQQVTTIFQSVLEEQQFVVGMKLSEHTGYKYCQYHEYWPIRFIHVVAVCVFMMMQKTCHQRYNWPQRKEPVQL